MAEAVTAKIDHVSHRYGKIARADVSIDFPGRRMVGVIGPDGVGKVDAALIAGVHEIQTGRVIVFGGDMANKAHREAHGARIAYMPQGLGRNLYPTLSVFENIDFHGRLFGQGAAERRERIAELLKATISVTIMVQQVGVSRPEIANYVQEHWVNCDQARIIDDPPRRYFVKFCKRNVSLAAIWCTRGTFFSPLCSKTRSVAAVKTVAIRVEY